MKKIIVIAACLFTLTTVVKAQEAPVKTHSTEKVKQDKVETAEQRATKSVESVNSIVGFTPDQKTKAYDLALTKMKNIDAVKAKYKGQADKAEAQKTEIQALKKEYQKNYKALLTPEQLQKLKAANGGKENKQEEGKD